MKGGDVEVGVAPPLYPGMMENPELRWAFIKKIYSILTVQILLTVAVCAVVVAVHPIADFLFTTSPGLAIYIVCLVLPFIISILLYTYRQKHPFNFVLLGFYTVSISFVVGLTCAFTSGRAILQAASVTALLVVGLTLYTFWAAKRGRDFKILGPFLFCSLVALIGFCVIRFLFPFGKITNTIFGCIGTIISSGYIIYDTDNLIKRYDYDNYIWASVNIYLDIINLFLSFFSQVLKLLLSLKARASQA
ncbi:protein LIFEGUARD 2-like [Nymphaea colorata]|nr:protein LIFEGUARD 2-like [Nymphaea colorata]